MDEDPPETLSLEQVNQIFGSSASPKNAVLLLFGERIYQNDRGVWRLLDNRSYSTVREMTDGS